MTISGAAATTNVATDQPSSISLITRAWLFISSLAEKIRVTVPLRASSRITDQMRVRIRKVVEHGPPDLMLGRYVQDHHADLSVIGAYGRGFIFHLMVGS